MNQIKLDIVRLVEEKTENVTVAVEEKYETLGASLLCMGVVTVLAAVLI